MLCKNIQCDLFTSLSIDIDHMEKKKMCRTTSTSIYIVSMWTWCAFTMWDLFEIENLIWNCTFLFSSFLLFIDIRHIHCTSIDSQHIFFCEHKPAKHLLYYNTKKNTHSNLNMMNLFWLKALLIINYITFKMIKFIS